MRTDSAIALLRAARSADPGWLPAHWSYLELMRREGRRTEALADYTRRARSGDPEMACYALLAGLPANGPSSEAFRAIELARHRGVGRCMAMLLPGLAPGQRDIPGLPRNTALFTRAVADAPGLSAGWLGFAGALIAVGDTAAADSVLAAALLHVRHPIERIAVLSRRAGLAEQRGRPALAEGRRQALVAAVERDGRPGVRVALYFHYRSNISLAGQPHHTPMPPAALARASAGMRNGDAISRGSVALGRGDYAAALPFYDSALAFARLMPDGENEVAVLLARGRALSKMGRLDEAEQTLRAAQRRAAGTRQQYSRAEIWHNLSHTYEAGGRTALALAASDSFVATAAALKHDPIRIISRHDAGLLRLGIGMHEAAHRQFDAMVALIRAERQNHYWAGEYYERLGNPRTALEFFRLGVTLDHGEQSLNLAGMARAYEALGAHDSAAVAARQHDRVIQAPTDVPLEPEVLSRMRLVDDAARLARQSAEARERGRNLQGAALGRLQAARILLDGDRPTQALAEIARADAHISALSLRVERVEALRLGGLASARRNDWPEARRRLDQAAQLAVSTGDVRLLRDVHLARGIVLAGAGDSAAALDALERAADAVVRATASIHDDLDRARFRAENLAPFDVALALAMRLRDSSDLVARWSARRKGAALALATRGPADARGVDLPGLQAALEEDHAIVDYLVLPDGVAAVVVRRGAVRAMRLPVSGDSVAELARRVATGFGARGQRVDLARARFDAGAARALHATLVAPLRPLLHGARRLTLIPDGAIAHVPFAALVTDAGSGEGTAFLVDELELDYALSLALVDHQRRRWSSRPLLLVWTDVPGAAAERDRIRSAWRGAVTEAGGSSATESGLARAVAPASVVHFAVHASAADRHPLATHLQLTPDTRADGLLHLPEVAALPLVRKLVVLAACESMAGPLVTGEGLMGLSRAFLAAGAGAVVATRWPVDASSANFAGVFYEHLSRDASPAASVRAAQLALRAAPATAHPFYWAGYVAVSGSSPAPR